MLFVLNMLLRFFFVGLGEKMGFFICINLEWDSVADAPQLLRQDCDSDCTETLEEEARERNICFDSFRLIFLPYAPTSEGAKLNKTMAAFLLIFASLTHCSGGICTL